MDRAAEILALLADPSRRPFPAGDVAVVVAHPDDETLGIGAQLPRLEDALLIHVTDGAPRDGRDAAAKGFASPKDYADARRRELAAALNFALVPEENRIALDLPDQEAALHLAALTRQLAALFADRGIAAVFTHAFEGGHPDHDSCAFAVASARMLLSQHANVPLGVIEMPFYRAQKGAWTVQSFVPHPDIVETDLVLGDEERRRKQGMLDAHVTQRELLRLFSCRAERFRPAPVYDFGQMPGGETPLYETLGLGLTGERWREFAGAALADLAVTRTPDPCA